MFHARLTPCSASAREIELSLEKLPLVFGRCPEAGVRIEDRWTSRRHCELRLADGVLWVYDLGSTHGTFVNGRLALEASLGDGDTLQVGLSTFRVSHQPAATAVPQLA